MVTSSYILYNSYKIYAVLLKNFLAVINQKQNFNVLILIFMYSYRSLHHRRMVFIEAHIVPRRFCLLDTKYFLRTVLHPHWLQNKLSSDWRWLGTSGHKSILAVTWYLWSQVNTNTYLRFQVPSAPLGSLANPSWLFFPELLLEPQLLLKKWQNLCHLQSPLLHQLPRRFHLSPKSSHKDVSLDPKQVPLEKNFTSIVVLVPVYHPSTNLNLQLNSYLVFTKMLMNGWRVYM